MNAWNKKKLLSGGLALSLLMGGAIYAYADESAGTQADPSNSTQSAPASPDAKHHLHGAKDGKRQEKSGAESLAKLSEILGMKPDEIKTQLKSGKSIADLAKAKGISETDLINKLVASVNQRIDEKVKAGKLEQAKADQIKKNLPDRIKKAVERKGLPDWKHGRHGDHHMMGVRPDMSKLADWIGVSKDELKAQLEAGKALADIAAAHGKTKEQLIAKIKDDMTPAIEKFVSRTRDHAKKDGNAGKAGGTQ